ncbi:hypothetical protein HK102_000548 [Quaeritorhiza haematococci]|nr:hypothetical protein HK102_000548 [Quaeritorhiza haematococci]
MEGSGNKKEGFVGRWRHWIILALTSLAVLGDYYCYDIPAVLNVPIQKWLDSSYDLYQWQLNSLYSVYAFPNIFMPLIGGILVDRLGAPGMLLVLAAAVGLGQGIFSLGISYKTFPVMVFGRGIFGIGSEALEVAQSRITADWFTDKCMSFAYSLNVSFAKIATVVNANLSPWIDKTFGTAAAVWAGFGICAVSYAGGLGIWYIYGTMRPSEVAGVNTPEVTSQRALTAQAESYPALDAVNDPDAKRTSWPAEELNRYKSKRTSETLMRLQVAREGSSHSINTLTQSNSTDNLLALSKDKSFENLSRMESFSNMSGLSSSENVSRVGSVDNMSRVTSSDNLLGLAEVKEPEQVMNVSERKEATESPHMTRKMFRFLKEIFSMGPRFWLLCATTIAVYGETPFFNISADCLLIDRFGHRELYLPASAAIVFVAHFLMWATTLTPFVAMSLLGISHSMFSSAMWSSVPFLVGSHQVGTAYGFVTVALNISLSIFPLVIAALLNTIVDEAAGEGERQSDGDVEGLNGAQMLSRFEYAQWFFMGSSLVGMALGVVLTVVCNRYKVRNDAGTSQQVSVSETQTIAAPDLFEVGKVPDR